MADQVETVELPPMGDASADVTVETETRPEDAPFGYKADGTPYKRDPTRYQTRSANARRATAPKKKSAAKTKSSPYRDSVLGLVQIVGLPLAAAGTRNEVFLADLVALDMTAPAIADAADSIAQSNPKVAAALDKLAEVGPFGLMIGALAPLILQVCCNHGMIAAGVMGTIEPTDLIEAVGPAAEPQDVAA